MGVTHVAVTVRNPTDSTLSWTGRFLVDTGAIESVVPASALAAVGIEPRATRRYELADGSERDFPVAAGELEVLGEIVGATLVFGSDEAEPLLGCTALESAGLEVDPGSQTLRKLPAVRLKAANRRRIRAPGCESKPAARTVEPDRFPTPGRS